MTARLVFDHGTLRLDGFARGSLVERLPGVLWDERTACHRAPPWRYGEMVRCIGEDRLGCEDHVGRWADVDPALWREVALRDYQRAALASWEQCGRRGIVALPTGAGKTRVALAAMALTQSPTLVLVPTRDLPEFLLRHRRQPERWWLCEVMGFWTPQYVTDKLERLRGAGLERFILCVDADRCCAGDERLPAGARVVRFTKRIPVSTVLPILEAGS
jgi:uncharacterized protein DUF790/XPB helicase-like protein/type III restriction/modification enzyme restriction subunit